MSCVYIFFFLSAAAQNIKCETKMRDKCKGVTCNRSVRHLDANIFNNHNRINPLIKPRVTSCRYNCPANCLYSNAKVWGTLYYDVVRLPGPSQCRFFPPLCIILSLNMYFFSSNPVFAGLRSITGSLIITAVWWKSQGRTVSRSLLKPQRTASSL